MKNNGSALLRSKATEGQAKIWVIVLMLVLVGAGVIVYLKAPLKKAEVNSVEPKELGTSDEADEKYGWTIYENEKYGFQFSYPSFVTPVEFNYEHLIEGSPCISEVYFYDSDVAREFNRTKILSVDYREYFHLCVAGGVGKGSSGSSLDGERYNYGTGALPFQKVLIGGADALELINHPTYSNIIIVQIKPGVTLTFSSKDLPSWFGDLKSSFHLNS